jgi:hypothetical protein
MLKLYEILVPAYINNIEIPIEKHQVWDFEISKLVGGCTIFNPVKGRWLGNTGLIGEQMIPVRIACSEQIMKKVCEFTAHFYEQDAIFAWKVSDQVIIHKRVTK